MNNPGRLYFWISDRPLATFAVFFAAIAVFIALSSPYRAAIGSDPLGGDGFYYYSYARSLLIDGDVNLRNEYQDYAPEDMVIFGISPDGIPFAFEEELPDYPDNYFAVGVALLWLPAIAIAHLLLASLSLLGFATPAQDGFSLPYIVSVGIAGCVYAYLGIALMFSALVRHFSNHAAFLTCCYFATATALINYVVIDPFYSHVGEFFASSLVVYLCIRFLPFRTLRVGQAAALGASIGLAALVRWQLVILGLVVFVGWLRDLLFARSPGAIFVKGVVVPIAAIAVFVPQLAVWHAIYGQTLTIPQGPGFFTLRLTGWLDVLLSNNHGMFFWHPVTGIAAVALAWLCLRPDNIDQSLTLTLRTGLAIFLAQAFINGSVFDVDAGTSFGMRRMIGTYPIICWGLAWAIERLQNRQELSKAIVLWLLASLWNLALLGIWTFRLGGTLFPR